MTRIAIITVEDKTWALPAFRRAIPELRKAGYEIAGLWLTEDRLARHQGLAIYLYYLRTFGFWTVAMLALFSLIARFGSLLQGKEITFRQLARKQGIPVSFAASPNDAPVVDWLSNNDIDIAVIMTPFIIRKPFLSAVKTGVINKHAAMLPANKGLFPYFWARLKGEPQGISFHVVDEGIDTGGNLWQVEVTDQAALASMISFYVHVFQRYTEGLLAALRALEEGRLVPPSKATATYHGLPQKQDYGRFRAVGGTIINPHDVLLGWRL